MPTTSRSCGDPLPSVLVVEDSEEASRHLIRTVERAPGLSLAGAARTLDQGLNLLSRVRPRIALVDLGLPDGSGLDLISAARQSEVVCDTIVISVFGDERSVFEAIEAGASGYLQKATTASDVVSSIETVLAGGSPISPGIARRVLTRLSRERLSEGDAPLSQDEGLTPREREILELVANGLQRREIAEALGIAIGTVGNHVHNIYRKLQVRSNIEAVSTALRRGLL